MNELDKERALANKIKELAKNEGLTVSEIASLLGYSPATIYRMKRKFELPGRVLRNRKDKPVECTKCGKIEYIRRHEKKRRLCSSCLSK